MNLPGAVLDVPVLTEQDATLISDFALKRNLDIVTATFARKEDDITAIRTLLDEKEQGKKVLIFAKIQNLEGLNNFEEILNVSDGIMLDRQALSMELSPEKVVIAQKWAIQ